MWNHIFPSQASETKKARLKKESLCTWVNQEPAIFCCYILLAWPWKWCMKVAHAMSYCMCLSHLILTVRNVFAISSWDDLWSLTQCIWWQRQTWQMKTEVSLFFSDKWRTWTDSRMRKPFCCLFKIDEPVSNLLGQIRITNESEQIAYWSLINKLIARGKS